MIIRSYHTRDLDLEYKYTEKDLENANGIVDNLLYFGFELEVQKRNDYPTMEDMNEDAKYIRRKNRELGLCFQTDGSVRNGFEIISQPMAFDYIQENKERFKNILEYLQEKGYSSHNGGNCGLHIHVSRNYFGNTEEEQEKTLRKLLLFTETYKDELERFSRRTSFSYCQFTSDRYNSEYRSIESRYLKSSKVLKDMNKNCDRYQVINTGNRDTIEIRVFRGTLKYETFMATLEFVNNLITMVKEKETRKISFDNVINYKETEYLKQYCEDKNIYNSTPMNDLSSAVEKELQIKKEKLNKANKEFQDIAKKSMETIADNLDMKKAIQENDRGFISVIAQLGNLINNGYNMVTSTREITTDNVLELINLNQHNYINEFERMLSTLEDTIRYNAISDETKQKLEETREKLKENLEQIKALYNEGREQ